MTLDEILDQYEDLWRKAALENQAQLSVNEDHSRPWGACAWLNPEPHGTGLNGSNALIHASNACHARWIGPAEVFPVGHETTLATLMIHANNGRWSWDMLANKFRGCVEPA